IRRLVHERPTYGYRRVTALVNRVLAAEGQPAANHKAARPATSAPHRPPQGPPARRQGGSDALEPALVLRCLRDGMERSSASSSSSMPMTGKCSLGMRWPASASAARWCAIWCWGGGELVSPLSRRHTPAGGV